MSEFCFFDIIFSVRRSWRRFLGRFFKNKHRIQTHVYSFIIEVRTYEEIKDNEQKSLNINEKGSEIDAKGLKYSKQLRDEWQIIKA